MPRSKSKKPPVDNYKFRPVYLDPSYTVEKELFADIKSGKFHIESSIIEMAELGWKVSISYSDHYDNYFISGSYKGSNHPTLNQYTFISKHSVFEKAFGLLARYALIEVEDRGNYGVEDKALDSW